MKKERLRVLDLLEQGKITADEATKLLEALKAQAYEYEECESDFAGEVEEKLNKFSKTMDSFAKDFGEKMSGAFKDVEPKVRNVTKNVIVRTAAIMDDISKSLNESLNNMEKGSCCCKEKNEDNAESEAAPENPCESPEVEVEEKCCGSDDEPREN